MAFVDPSGMEQMQSGGTAATGGAEQAAVKTADAEHVVPKVGMKLQDLNGDGHTSGSDLTKAGYKPGTPEGKAAWQQIDQQAQALKSYMGRPLNPGENPGDGDFQLLKDRLIWEKGLSFEAAAKIAAKVNQQINSGS